MCQRILLGIILGLLCLYSLTGTNASSFLRLDPPRIVASFGSSISANCSTDLAGYLDMDWEKALGNSTKTGPKTVTWIVESLTKWDMKPYCFINVSETFQEQLPLNLTVYKTPDSVSISIVGHTVPMDEGQQCKLQCAVQNVAPVGNVIVKWYKGETLVGNTTFSESSKNPDNLLATLQISPSKNDNGSQYRCEAVLDLEPKGPQPPPAMMSDPLTITVKYCPITVHPAKLKLVVEHGASASANCSTSVTHKGMGWEASQEQVDMTENVQFITWSVKSIEEWDIAPLCYITQEADQCQVHLTVTVYKIPDSVSISTVGHTGPMIEGRQYELQCALQNVAPVGKVIVKWYKGDTLVGSTTFNDSSKTPENLLATLQISPSRDDDRAQYRCKAELDLGPEGPQPPPAKMSDPLSITVYYGPEISCSDNFTVIQNKEFTPIYTVQGHPTPEITWYKEGSTVSFPKKMGINDAGLYILNASSYTSDIHQVKIEVLYAPSAIKELEKTTINQSYDGVLKCCSVSIPRPDYKWTYPPAANVRVENVDGVSLLHLDYVTVHNTGSYTCTAYNFLGNTSQSVRVEIGAPQTISASITTVNHSGPMIEGDQYELSCDVEYVAPVQQITVNWYKGTTQLKSRIYSEHPQTEHKTQTNLSDTLRVSSNRTDNGAQYKCMAELKPKADGAHRINITSELLNITVHYKPVINTSKLPSVVPVFRGYPEVLVCEAEGYPAPTIIWKFKSKTFEGENYTIEEATHENVGLYNCTAINSVDTTVRMVKVILKEDYLPLIAGFVALVVVITSVFFIIIYSIYYKNTKMGRYMVEGAKPNAQNGNVAQNGKDSTIPMKKLSQNSISL